MVSENPGGPTDSHEEKCPEANRKCRTTGPPHHVAASLLLPPEKETQACTPVLPERTSWCGAASPHCWLLPGRPGPMGNASRETTWETCPPGQVAHAAFSWRRQLNCPVHFRLLQTPALFLPGFLTSLILNMVIYVLCLCIWTLAVRQLKWKQIEFLSRSCRWEEAEQGKSWKNKRHHHVGRKKLESKTPPTPPTHTLSPLSEETDTLVSNLVQLYF